MAEIPLWTLSSVLIAFILTWGARKVALYNGLTDKPSYRKKQTQAVPYLGGVAVCLTFLILSALYWLGQDVQVFSRASISTLVLLCLLILLVGLIDDVAIVHYRTKFIFQTIIAAGASLALATSATKVFLFKYQVINILATVLVIVIFMNAINFMDNMDGLTAGLISISLSFLSIIALRNQQEFVAVSAMIIVGAMLGFLPWNFPNARIYLGDAGTLFLGFIGSALGIQLSLPQISRPISLLIALQIFSIHIFDFLLVIIFRLLRKVNPATPGRDHLSHRLEYLGLTRTKVTLLIWLLGIIGGSSAILTPEHPLISLTVSAGLLLFSTGIYIKTSEIRW